MHCMCMCVYISYEWVRTRVDHQFTGVVREKEQHEAYVILPLGEYKIYIKERKRM